VHAQDGRTVLRRNQRRSNAAEHPVANLASGQRPDHRLARQAGQYWHAGRRHPVQFTQQRKIVFQRLAETKTRINNDA
jgi:hypothetical protein